MIRLSRARAAMIAAAGAAAWPNEACGLLIGRRSRLAGAPEHVLRIVPTANVSPCPARRFEIDPREHFDWQRALRGTDRDVIGIYHSHPTGDAEPSARDAAMALDPGLVWLILAVAPPNRADGPAVPGALAAFRPAADGSGFAPLAICHDDDPPA